MILSLQPAVLLRKLPGTVIPGRAVVYRALSRHTSEALIRRHGRIVAVQGSDGWKVRDQEGKLGPAGPGLSRVYDLLEMWRG